MGIGELKYGNEKNIDIFPVKSIATTHTEKYIGLTASDGDATVTIWLTQKEAEKLIELLRIELACSKVDGDNEKLQKTADDKDI